MRQPLCPQSPEPTLPKRSMSLTHQQQSGQAKQTCGLSRARLDRPPPQQVCAVRQEQSSNWLAAAAGRSAAAVRRDVALARRIALGAGGKVIAPTIPRLARAQLFQDLNGVLGPDGRRWAALNAKVAHSEASALVTKFDTMIADWQAEMAARQVTSTKLASALSNHAFSFEPVFHWRDSWLPIHLERVDTALLASFEPPEPNPDARALVDLLRGKTVELFREMGAASNQIGRTYPFRPALSAAPEAMLAGIKRLTDPRSLMNPGVLGF